MWTAPGHGSAATADRAWSPVGRIMVAFPDRARNAIVLTAEHIAAHLHAPSAAQLPPTPAAGVPGAAAAAAVALCPRLFAAPPAQGEAAARGGVEPFWADMIRPADSDSAAAGREKSSTGERQCDPETLDLTRTGAVAGSGQERVLAIGRPGASPLGGDRVHRWDLVVVELGCRPCDDGLGLLGAKLLAPGGVLAVLTHSERRGGRLIDPTGSVVASAQAADLLYLQHIVVLTTPLPAAGSGAVPSTGRRPADAQRASAGGAASEAPAPGGGAMDLLLFLQPRDPEGSAPGPLGSAAPAEPPGAGLVVDSSHAARHVMNGDRA